jgi:hypothetical protein
VDTNKLSQCPARHRNNQWRDWQLYNGFFNSRFYLKNMDISILIAAFGGGVVRGLIGYIKHQYSYKNVGFNLPYFFVMMFLSGIVGTVAAAAFDLTAPLALVVGYAGGDFLDNIYKTLTKKITL